MNGLYILDEHGEYIAEQDTITWARWFESADRTVAVDEIDGCRVSTVLIVERVRLAIGARS